MAAGAVNATFPAAVSAAQGRYHLSGTIPELAETAARTTWRDVIIISANAKVARSLSTVEEQTPPALYAAVRLGGRPVEFSDAG